MKFVAFTFCALLLGGLAGADETITVQPAVVINKADYDRLVEINQLLHERQKVVDKIMAKYGLQRLKPAVPKYGKMSENSVQALLNQLDYTALAEKVGAEMPAPPALTTGPAFSNNLFLHSYNHAILRAIASKLEVELPPSPAGTQESLEARCFEVVSANNHIVNLIAAKLGL